MTITVQLTDNKARITIAGRFDSSSYKEFKQSYTPVIENPAIRIVEVDVSGVEYLDSAALGMLVQLNEHAKNTKKSITLVSVPGRVSDILRTASADKLFTINLPSGIKMDLR
ncbi:MAG TPA: STAS domain-containing protein [Gallionella sp.]|nr:STAS domain-containing protein [Gallionella sp.]